MNTKNTKTAVIILLLIANIYFIYNIISLKISSENISPEMIDDAVNILEKKGFIVDRNIIPGKIPANWIYEGEYMQNRFADIVKSFSGVSDEEIVGDMFGPSGTSYTAGEYKFMFSEKEKKDNKDNADFFKISIMDIKYGDPEKGFAKLEEETQRDMELLAEKGINENQKGDIKKVEKTIKNFIKKYQNQDIKLGFEMIGFKEDRYRNCECVLLNQTADGLLIDSHTAYIEIQDGNVKYFYGNWYFGKLLVVAKRMPLFDSVNILFKCWETDGSIVQGEKLEKMNMEYNVSHQDAENFNLTPSWQLVFESGRKLSYDMISGNKKIKS